MLSTFNGIRVTLRRCFCPGEIRMTSWNRVCLVIEKSQAWKKASLEDGRRQGLVENALFCIRLKAIHREHFPQWLQKKKKKKNPGLCQIKAASPPFWGLRGLKVDSPFVQPPPFFYRALCVSLKGFSLRSQVVEWLLLILGAVDGEFAKGLFVAYILTWNPEAIPGGQRVIWLHLWRCLFTQSLTALDGRKCLMPSETVVQFELAFLRTP